MDSTISTLAEFDNALLEEYCRFVEYFPEKDESFIQRRFAQYGIFPKLGWDLICIGEEEALSCKDPAVLYGTISRFVKCAQGNWGPADDQGIHCGGYDFCTLTVHTLYSALIGKELISSAFHCERPISDNGYGAFKHAANLMVCLECHMWPHKEKALKRARSFVSSKSNSKTDKAFVSFFLAVHSQDRAAIANALVTFSEGYLRSDWGRYKPKTRPTFIQALIAYARFYVVDPVDTVTHQSLVSDDRHELWRELDIKLQELHRNPHQFLDALSFLNEITVC